jgi:hypothetical protein
MTWPKRVNIARNISFETRVDEAQLREGVRITIDEEELIV